MRFVNHLEVNKNQLLEAVIHKGTQEPASPVSGQLYYRSDHGALKVHDGASWKFVWTGNMVLAGDGLAIGAEDINTGQFNIKADVDNLTIGVDINNKIHVKSNSLAGSHLSPTAAIAYTQLAHTLNANRVIGKMGAAGALGEVRVLVSSESLSSLNSDTTLVSSKAIKDYVDAQITSGVTPSFQGGWNANTQNVFPGGTGTKPGDYWYVSHQGTIQGRQFRVHDVIIARIADPGNTSAADYVFLESDKDLATTSVAGWVTMATEAQMNSGLSGAIAVTPARVHAWVNAQGFNKRFAQTIGNGTLSQFDITHNLGHKNITVAVYENGGAEQQVFPTVSILSNTQIRVVFSFAPTSNAYRVVVHG